MSTLPASPLNLPLLDHHTPVIGTRALQQMTAAKLDSLKTTGPQIVEVNGVKRAVLVDFDQFSRFQDRFHEMFSITARSLPVLQKLPSLERQGWKIEDLTVQVEATVRKIIEEQPAESPFSSYMDSLLTLAAGLFENSTSAPVELQDVVKKELKKGAKRVKRKGGSPKRNIAE